MYKKIRNILPKKTYEKVNNEVWSFNFPWYYLCNSAYDNFPFDNNQNKTFSFHHTTMRDRDSNSWFNEPTLEIGNIMKKKFKLDNYEIIRLRWGMTTSSNEDIRNNAHIDSPDKHKVILFYLNDSDGPTYFYKDEHDDVIGENMPEQNSAILFEGDQYHSSSRPIKYDRRIVLNINLVEVQNEK